MVTQNHSANLANLVGLRVPAIALQIDALLNTWPSEDMVAAANALFEFQTSKQRSEFVKRNVGIRATSQYAIQQVAILGHGRILQEPLSFAAMTPRQSREVPTTTGPMPGC